VHIKTVNMMVKRVKVCVHVCMHILKVKRSLYKPGHAPMAAGG